MQLTNIIWSGIFLVIMIILNITGLYTHEIAHENIYNYHGCMNTSITIQLDKGVTKCTDTYYSKEHALQATYLHALHESITYNTQTLVVTLQIGIFFWLLIRRYE